MKAENKISSILISTSFLFIALAIIAWKINFSVILNLLLSVWAIEASIITIAWINHAYSIIYFNLHPDL